MKFRKKRRTVIVKPKRYVYVLNIFVPLLLVGMVLLSLGSIIINSIILVRQSEDRGIYLTNITETCVEYERTAYDQGDKNSEESINNLAKLKFALTVAQVSGIHVEVSDINTGEVIAQSMDRGCVVLRTEGEEEPRFFTCDDASLFEPFMKQYGDRIDRHYANYMADWTRMDVYSMLNIEEDIDYSSPVGIKLADFYINEEDHTFLPGKVVAYLTDKKEDKQVMIDCTPSDTSGYSHIYESDCKTLLFFNSFGADKYFYDSSDDVNQIIKGTLPDLAISYCEQDQVSIYKAAPEVVFFSIVLLVAGTFLIGFVFGSIKYSRAYSIYEVFEYRKKVTDSLAHDLKTPLAAISAYSENLEENADSDRRKYYSEKIRENVGSMNRMIEGVLDFSRSENCAVRIGEVEVRKLVEEEFESIRALFEKNDLAVEIKGEDVTVRTDAALLRQAVKNLLSNAAKFARKGSRVTIITGKDSLVIENETDGKITDTEEIKKPFVKGSSERGETEGTGLGLAIADSSLTAAGHRLDIRQEGDLFRAKVIW